MSEILNRGPNIVTPDGRRFNIPFVRLRNTNQQIPHVAQELRIQKPEGIGNNPRFPQRNLVRQPSPRRTHRQNVPITENDIQETQNFARLSDLPFSSRTLSPRKPRERLSNKEIMQYFGKGFYPIFKEKPVVKELTEEEKQKIEAIDIIRQVEYFELNEDSLLNCNWRSLEALVKRAFQLHQFIEDELNSSKKFKKFTDNLLVIECIAYIKKSGEYYSQKLDGKTTGILKPSDMDILINIALEKEITKRENYKKTREFLEKARNAIKKPAEILKAIEEISNLDKTKDSKTPQMSSF